MKYISVTRGQKNALYTMSSRKCVLTTKKSCEVDIMTIENCILYHDVVWGACCVMHELLLSQSTLKEHFLQNDSKQ